MKKLPLTIETDLHVRSLDVKTLQTKSRILGARHGDFLLIEEPVCHVGERVAAVIQGAFICSFFHDGDIYRFESKIKKSLGDGLSLIAYPAEFQIENIRKAHRVQVNIEAQFSVADGAPGVPSDPRRREVYPKGDIVDISQGGCHLILPALLHLYKNMPCRLDFILPDNQHIVGLQAQIRNVQFSKLKKITEIGLQFMGPPQEVAKIASFCQFCMFFKV